MSSNSYKKLKFLVKKLLKHEIIKKNLTEYESVNLTESNYREFITKLNDIKCLNKVFKGEHTLCSDYVDKNYFFDDDMNTSLISAIAYAEEKSLKYNIINYFLKLVPKNIIFMINNNYMKKFNKNIVTLLDTDKYLYFSNIIEKNTSSSKTICQIFNKSKNKFEIIIPLELFIHEDSWCICYYDYELKDIFIIDSQCISESKVFDEAFSNYIKDSDVDEIIKGYVENLSESKECIFLRLKPETLNLLVNFELIDDFIVYKENEDENKLNLNQNGYKPTDNSLKEFKLEKIDLNETSYLNNQYDFKKKITFNKNQSKYYIVEIKCTQNKLNYILSKFNNIKIVDISKYDGI